MNIFTLFALLSVVFAYPKDLAEYSKQAQDSMDQYASTYNTSFQFAVANEHLNATFSAGIENHNNGRKLLPTDSVPVGSVMKGYTGMGIMRLLEQGVFGLNTTVAPLIDPFLMKINGTTMLELWKGDTTINQVTIWQLLHMQAGLDDYDDGAMRAWTMANPNKDFSPLDYIHTLPKKFICTPGKCEMYSSNGFEILGFVLASHYGAEDWASFDWWMMFPDNLRSQYFKSTKFLVDGSCAEQGTTNSYFYDFKNQWPGLSATPYQMDNDSCLNGWGFGNLAASAQDIANFYYQYFGSENIIKYETAAEMMHFDYMDNKYFNISYGLGVMPAWFDPAIGPNKDVYPNYQTFEMIGHEGQDWGSGAPMAGYNFANKLGVAFVTGTATGMSCALKGDDFMKNFSFQTEISCLLYDLTLQYLSKGTIYKLPCLKIADETTNSQLTIKPRSSQTQDFYKSMINKDMDASEACFPWCDSVCGSSGPCNACKACIGKSDVKACEPCFKVDYSNPSLPKACLDAKSHNRCEACWARTPEATQAFIQ